MSGDQRPGRDLKSFVLPESHEHACVRCPVLIVGPDERPCLEEIRENLHARIAEAKREGWLGDVEQLTVNLTATHDKISQIDASERRKSSPVFVGKPRTATSGPGSPEPEQDGLRTPQSDAKRPLWR